MRRATIFLMYHELARPAEPLCRDEEGYARYAVQVDAFRRQLGRLAALGSVGRSVGAWLAAPSPADVVITFDDGCATDLLVAAPLLAEAGFGATFYVTSGFLGRPGFLDDARVRALLELGFEVGSHGVTHRFLTELAPRELREELVSSRHRLEDAIGGPVLHLSCPGGRVDHRVVTAAREAGYRSVATSHVGGNLPGASPFGLRRDAIMRDTTDAEFEALCTGRGAAGRRLRAGALGLARRVLGNATYDRVRGRLLGDA